MNFFIILYVVFIVSANLIGFLVFKKSKNLYLVALVILGLAGVFGVIGAIWAVSILEDGFAAFFGFNLASYLFFNSIIVLLFAFVGSIIKKIKE
ncbi:3-isopropylmalate dehydrogenase [Bacillus suaedae]|uniref:3-isopropylmalate dehydrogenase n=1 Tax=Halalkalibacter suaedae TaxID=2822140 RepID=A0A940WZA8_9BACI|nr:3-isopropylmalate dehydrogenase [Bacillus suaedae]MBP3953647.1 3-isopropylmalate dehydrogenase [Bacillus suaedae]